MAVQAMRFWGDPALHQPTTEIKRVDRKIRKLAIDMVDTMHHYKGQGLASNQIGSTESIIVVDLSGKIYKILNPMMTWYSEETVTSEEGCLSIPGYTGQVKRYKSILLQYKNIEGGQSKLRADDLLSIILQHELDHLLGILLVHRAIPGTLKLYNLR